MVLRAMPGRRRSCSIRVPHQDMAWDEAHQAHREMNGALALGAGSSHWSTGREIGLPSVMLEVAPERIALWWASERNPAAPGRRPPAVSAWSCGWNASPLVRVAGGRPREPARTLGGGC